LDVRSKGVLCLAVLVGLLVCLTGCAVQKLDTESGEELEYEELDEADVPEEMQTAIEERKNQAFLLTYADQGSLYIARGYGEQETDGYNIQVQALYESDNAIVCKTILWGPEPGEEVSEEPTYPYLVIRTRYSDKYVAAE
jgi:hypothetical protein